VLLWQRYDNKMVAMCYYGNVILHLQQYSHRLNLLCFLFIYLSFFVISCFSKFELYSSVTDDSSRLGYGGVSRGEQFPTS